MRAKWKAFLVAETVRTINKASGGIGKKEDSQKALMARTQEP